MKEQKTETSSHIQQPVAQQDQISKSNIIVALHGSKEKITMQLLLYRKQLTKCLPCNDLQLINLNYSDLSSTAQKEKVDLAFIEANLAKEEKADSKENTSGTNEPTCYSQIQSILNNNPQAIICVVTATPVCALKILLKHLDQNVYYLNKPQLTKQEINSYLYNIIKEQENSAIHINNDTIIQLDGKSVIINDEVKEKLFEHTKNLIEPILNEVKEKQKSQLTIEENKEQDDIQELKRPNDIKPPQHSSKKQRLDTVFTLLDPLVPLDQSVGPLVGPLGQLQDSTNDHQNQSNPTGVVNPELNKFQNQLTEVVIDNGCCGDGCVDYRRIFDFLPWKKNQVKPFKKS